MQVICVDWGDLRMELKALACVELFPPSLLRRANLPKVASNNKKPMRTLKMRRVVPPSAFQFVHSHSHFAHIIVATYRVPSPSHPTFAHCPFLLQELPSNLS